ncbi:MAG: hypothetical protein PF961_11325 [Planctomycetota bacterium]|jgi:hypothetical protein|nr:hypothetical protein [Planctomycetota bacterium]
MRHLILALVVLAPFGLAAAGAPYNAFVTTADGNGADATIQQDHSGLGTQSSIQVRNNQHNTHWMKGYLRFDLSKVQPNPKNPPKGRKMMGAQLHLVVSTGKVALLEKGTFNVFGLKERKDYGQAKLGEDWAEAKLEWNNAPGNEKNRGGGDYDKGANGTGGANHDQTVFLGTFTVEPQGPGTEVVFASRELGAFIAEDSNRSITLIIARANSHINPWSFAAKESDKFDPPKLSFVMR